ncbi:hypothetical protein THIOM_001964 [Candidatus Thiomargarita nelsonii]|uniref:Uncharacterized protein n=1 Tax=Candidatus Thiomargarita nelsonii TaxID=1003181 RepID=A0A176S2J8_9GAMM|nr:hypothetical protein THIOM_001964 [Candidatus Thiomargarita nelsonii]
MSLRPEKSPSRGFLNSLFSLFFDSTLRVEAGIPLLRARRYTQVSKSLVQEGGNPHTTKPCPVGILRMTRIARI